MDTLIDNFSEFANSDPIQIYYSQVLQRLESLGETKENLDKTRKIFNILKKPFQTYDTKHKCFEYLIKNGTLIEPEQITVGYRTDYVTSSKSNANLLNPGVPIKISFVPVSKVLQKFFEIPDMLKSTLDYM